MAKKVEQIAQFASSSDKVRQLTGFADGTAGGDLTKDLFHLVALLELYSSAYLDADCYFARAHSMSTVVNPPKDRLLCYLQLVGQIKRFSQGGQSARVRSKRDSSQCSDRNVSTDGAKGAA